MSRKRKTDSIDTVEKFNEYVSGKNPRARKMLEIFYEMMEGRTPELWKHSDIELMLRDPKNMEVPFNTKLREHGLYVELKILKYDRGHVALDTGAVEIDDRGKLSPTEWGKTFNVYYLTDANGLEGAAKEFIRIAEIYRKIFGKGHKNSF